MRNSCDYYNHESQSFVNESAMIMTKCVYQDLALGALGSNGEP